jgi:hypothetical protein
MQKLTSDFIETYYQKMFREAKERAWLTPNFDSEITLISDIARGLFTLEVWQNHGSTGNPLRVLKEYSVSQDAIDVIVAEFLGPVYVEQAEKNVPARRADKWALLEAWAKKNTFQEVDMARLIEITGFSYKTILNYLKTSPYFRKIKNGTYEVRDPKEDRKHEKNG